MEKKNFITVNWSVEDCNPWTSEMEITRVSSSGFYCKVNDPRIRIDNEEKEVFIPISKSKYNDYFDITELRAHGIMAYIKYEDVEKVIKENGWKIGEYDFHPVIIDESFDKKMTVKEAYYKSNVIGRIINKFPNDLDTAPVANMTLAEANKIKYDTPEYWEAFNCDSAVRWMIGFLLKNMVK